MDFNLPIIAGTVSTIIFGMSALPMLIKAFRTKDLASYSRSNILMANTGNVVHSIYVFHLPPGPIWMLHSFYLVSTALMLVWYLRYEWQPHISIRPPVPRHRTGTLSTPVHRQRRDATSYHGSAAGRDHLSVAHRRPDPAILIAACQIPHGITPSGE